MKNFTMIFRAAALSVSRQQDKEKGMQASAELEKRLERYYNARSNFISEVLRCEHNTESFDMCTRLEDIWKKTANVHFI